MNTRGHEFPDRRALVDRLTAWVELHQTTEPESRIIAVNCMDGTVLFDPPASLVVPEHSHGFATSHRRLIDLACENRIRVESWGSWRVYRLHPGVDYSEDTLNKPADS